MAKEIKLTRGKFALVDDEDFEELNKYKWNCNHEDYAVRNSSRLLRKDYKQDKIWMHRVILNVIDKNAQVDHINGNKLDNRKENLRLCNNTTNQYNTRVHKDNKSGYKGVSLLGDLTRHKNPYRSTITVNKKSITLGHFSTAIEAAKMYDIAAIKYFGEFAKTNASMGLL